MASIKNNVKGDYRLNETQKEALLQGILKKLRPFQREAYEFATKGTPCSRPWSKDEVDTAKATNEKKRKRQVTKPPLSATRNNWMGRGRILLADEMGLGKTISSLAIMSHYAEEWPLLILCPASLRHQWPCEIEKFLPTLPVNAVHVVSGFDDVGFVMKPSLKIVVAPYSLLQTRSAVARVLQEMQFQCVIADESHNLKERTSQKSKLAMPLLTRAKRVVLLSGTPALARPVELWTQATCIAPELFPNSFTAYTKQYCNAHRNRFGRWDVTGLSNAAELHSKLSQIMVRRLKSHVLTELPPKQRTIIPMTIANSKQKQQSQALIQELRDTKSEMKDWFVDNAKQAHWESQRLVMACYQASGIAKAPAVADYLLDWLRGSATQKILVFCHHAQVMDTIEEALQKHNKRTAIHVRIDGSVPSQNRAVLVRKFQNNSQTRVALLSMTAAGVGLTLTAASSVLFAELHWTPGVLAQAEDRCHRMGQANAVHVVYGICKDANTSIDSSLWNMLGRKVGTLGRVIDGCKGASMEAKDGKATMPKSKSGESAEDELVRFFAESSAEERAVSQAPPAKGSILNYFQKPAASKKEPKENHVKKVSTPTQRTMSLGSKASGGLDRKKRANGEDTTFPWACEACTFENQQKKKSRNGWLACEMCRTPYAESRTNQDEEQEAKQQDHPVVIELDSQATAAPTNNAKRDKKTMENEIIVIDSDNEESRPNQTTDVAVVGSIVTPSSVPKRKKARAEKGGAPQRQENSKACVLNFSVSVNSGRVLFHHANSSSGASLCCGIDIDNVLTEDTCDAFLSASMKRTDPLSKAAKSALSSKAAKSALSIKFKDSKVLQVVRGLPKGIAKDSKTVQRCCHELKSFVSDYLSLREVEKKALKESGRAVSPFGVRKTLATIMVSSVTNCTERYKGGAMERAKENTKNGTATASDHAVLAGTACAWCGGLLNPMSLAPGVESKYCSQGCAESGRLGRGGMYASTRVRDQVFRLEGGVCQKCGMDAHSLYRRICALRPSERLNTLCSANWRLPKSGPALERLLQNPKEGDFWQADHIVAVAEGGGTCGLDNLQTLCTPCHKVETSKLRARLRLSADTGRKQQEEPSVARRQMDIRSSFPIPHPSSTCTPPHSLPT